MRANFDPVAGCFVQARSQWGSLRRFSEFNCNVYNHSARKRGRQASTGILTIVGCHAGLPYAAR